MRPGRPPYGVDEEFAIQRSAHRLELDLHGVATSGEVRRGEALGIRRATIRGTLLPGIVSLWQPAEGPATGLPYVVFAGNVGTDDSLAEVVRRFDNARA